MVFMNGHKLGNATDTVTILSRFADFHPDDFVELESAHKLCLLPSTAYRCAKNVFVGKFEKWILRNYFRRIVSELTFFDADFHWDSESISISITNTHRCPFPATRTACQAIVGACFWLACRTLHGERSHIGLLGMPAEVEGPLAEHFIDSLLRFFANSSTQVVLGLKHPIGTLRCVTQPLNRPDFCWLLEAPHLASVKPQALHPPPRYYKLKRE